MFDPETYDWLERETISEYVPIADMFVDRYQRVPSEAKINQILRSDFDPDALGTIALSLRGKKDPHPGLYAIVDGNHRVQLCRKLGITHIFARVFIDKTYQEEAALYRKLNNRHRMTALDAFRGRIEEGELQALEMRDLLAAHQLRLGSNQDGIGVISAVASLDHLYADCGPRGFAEIIALIHGAWAKERRAWIGAIIDGVKQFWIRYQGEADEKRLIDRLKLIHPEDILRNAQVGLVKRGSAGTRVGRQIYETYNAGLRSPRRLSEWSDHPGKGYEGRGGRPSKGGDA
jgi:hypothetical protein